MYQPCKLSKLFKHHDLAGELGHVSSRVYTAQNFFLLIEPILKDIF